METFRTKATNSNVTTNYKWVRSRIQQSSNNRNKTTKLKQNPHTEEKFTGSRWFLYEELNLNFARDNRKYFLLYYTQN